MTLDKIVLLEDVFEAYQTSLKNWGFSSLVIIAMRDKKMSLEIFKCFGHYSCILLNSWQVFRLGIPHVVGYDIYILEIETFTMY